MTASFPLGMDEIEAKTCGIIAEQLAIPRNQLQMTDRLIEDLRIDSLDMVELFDALEDAFDVSLPSETGSPVYKSVFTRQPFRIHDLAELIYLRQGSGKPRRSWLGDKLPEIPATTAAPFTQLDGRWHGLRDNQTLIEPIEVEGGIQQFRRVSDGMRCILVPSDAVEIGSDPANAVNVDESPWHIVEVETFRIDAEPVSTRAYCRFLNSVGDVDPAILLDWFILDDGDDRVEHMLIRQEGPNWSPIPGAGQWPMILVSWYGACAYSLWANNGPWQAYRELDVPSFLPSETQWEYAARGSRSCRYPWGDGEPTETLLRFGRHRKSATYLATTLPLASVNERLGMSPFGLHHMAGNVWQWCSDWYDPGFYATPEATLPNAVNRSLTKVRSERGGSWIGPAELCRSSYRRGRPPHARGRCLGFRCVSRA